MQRRNSVVGMLLLLIITIWPASAQTIAPTPPAFTRQTDPASLIASYYNAITLGDYQRAYDYWLSMPGNYTEAEFAAGYVDTAKVQVLIQLPIHEQPSPDGVTASISTLLIATRRDGTQSFYSGCYIAHKTATSDDMWYIQNAKLSLQPALDLTALAATCPELSSLMDDTIRPAQLEPLQTIQSYFAALARSADSARYWEDSKADPILQLYEKELTYTRSISLFVNPEVKIEPSADSDYALVSGLVVLNGANNVYSYLPGCYTLRRINASVANTATPDSKWALTNVALGGFSDDASTAINTVAQGCLS
jgi:hypothetical protein